MKEIWKDIEGYEDLYQINNFGNVKRLKRLQMQKGRKLIEIQTNNILKPNISKGGYSRVWLFKNNIRKEFKLHRLIASHFIPNPENKTQINHKDGNKKNNDIPNLEWCTPSDNVKHSYKLGLASNRGIRNPSSMLTEDQVYRIKWIKKYINPKKGYWNKITRALGTSSSTIYKITNNKNWKHVKV